VRLSVKDAGVGFTPEIANKLFEAFDTTKNDGRGIGLSISTSIIEAHHRVSGRHPMMDRELHFRLLSLVDLRVWLTPKLVPIGLIPATDAA